MPDYRDLYFPRRDLIYNQEQFLWLLKSLKDLKEGNYPPDPTGTGYIDRPIRKKDVRDEAAFVKVVLVAAQVELRISMCGLDGLLLKATEAWGETPEWLFKALNPWLSPHWKLTEVEVSHRASRALRYCASGPIPRWQTTHRKNDEGKIVVKRWGRTYREFVNYTDVKDLVAFKRQKKEG